MNARELREKRAGLIHQARKILDQAGQEQRPLSAEEEQRWDRLMEEADRLLQQAERLERQEAAERSLDEIPQQGIRPEPDGNPGERAEDPQAAAAFRRYLIGGMAALSPDERRALQADVDVSGGYLVAPMEFVNALIKAVDDAVYLRQWATIHRLRSAASLGVPSLDTDPSDADWTTELATGSEDSSMAFGRRELSPYPLAKRIKVSRKLLRLSADAEAIVRDRLAYKFAITWEKALLLGTGTNQPLGVFVASSHGISTSRDVSDGNTQTAIQADGLINAKYTLKQQYWRNARWLFHRDAVKQIAKLKDSNGQYIWREGMRAGEPDTLLGFPVYMSEFAPNTFTAGQYVGILGDFSFVWIAEGMAFEIQRLDELYAESNQIGFIGRMEGDGMPVLEEAFVRVQLAS